eukprot:m51a1_g11439 putative serine-pyruvate transaminase (385) ;mRNA; f:21735-22949
MQVPSSSSSSSSGGMRRDRGVLRMYAGPTRVSAAVLGAYGEDWGSPDAEAEAFGALYERTEAQLRQLLGQHAPGSGVPVLSGEAMAVLWGALKSALAPGDRVVSLCNGLFGAALADMAAALGARVLRVPYGPRDGVADWWPLERALAQHRPAVLTAVHCETPTGALNDAAQLGALKRKHRVPLLCLDAVSSVGGAPVLADAWSADLVLGGAQKCLSAPPSVCFAAVSAAAWEKIASVKYEGYDALLPFRDAAQRRWFPYTHSWHGVAALSAACSAILDDEGLDRCHARHAAAAARMRDRLARWPALAFLGPGATPSPTVTAASLPPACPWAAWDAGLRARGVAVAPGLDDMAGKLFRVGHMGTQANIPDVDRVADAVDDLMLSL